MEVDFPRASRRNTVLLTILDFRPPELSDDKSVLFEATKLVVICYSSYGKLILSILQCTL